MQQLDLQSAEAADMRPGLVVLLCVFSCALRSECAPPTCYSRALELSREIMTLLDRVHTSHRTVSMRTSRTLSFLIYQETPL